MLTKENVQSNIIILGLVGSRAFGLSNQNSDYDYMGVAYAPLEQYWGIESLFGTFNEWDDPPYNMYPMLHNSDTTVYELTKYVGLACKGNPNILDLLFLDSKLYVSYTDVGKLLIDNRDLFLVSECKKAYLGYAQSEMKRIFNKPTLDCKRACQLIRLMKVGISVISGGPYIVDRKIAGDAEELLSIKEGHMSFDEFRTLSNDLFCKLIDQPNNLPTLDRGKVNELSVNMMRLIYDRYF